ncbi:MAG: methyltransferase domain-containing protein [Ignavibacteriales bacterium]|nr:methyltransferase domain-containing protein [Ignavibacteriales bacterium]
MDTLEINKRYGELAESSCCLSCGGAINYAEPQKNEVCVDLGCGRGNDVLRMAEEVGPNGFVYGVDISDGMLEKAKANSEKFGVTNVKFVKSELEQIEISDKQADLIISNCTINHASDKLKVWQEIHRILKKGGRFSVSDIYSLIDVPDEYKNDPVAVAECWAGAIRKDLYIDILEKVGFVDIDIIEESQPYDKGKIKVASFTVVGKRKNCGCSD